MDKNRDNIIDVILSSNAFANKEVQKGLLKFLYESMQKGLSLKEIDIALGFFKRGNDFMPGEDTIVRVNIHKLRTLLEKFYAEEGRNEETIVEIPKGNYTVNFSVKGPQVSAHLYTTKQRSWLYFLLGFSLVLNLFLFVYPYLQASKPDHPVWADYIRSGLPVYLTLGDPFFFRIKDTASSEGRLTVRDISINSTPELKKHSTYKLLEAPPANAELTYPYFSKNNVWPLPDLISVFSKANIETRIQALSEINMEDIKSNNIVFIGNINSFGFMNRFLEKTSLRLFTNPRQIRINKGKDSLILSVPEHIQGYYVDYAFFVKVPGPGSNYISLMGDFHASGIKGLSSYISKESTLSKLRNKVKKDFGEFPEYFEMVVKVTSYNYSDFDTEVIYFKPLLRGK